MNHDPSPNPRPIQSVRVKRHRVDWEASDLDLAEITAERAMSLAPELGTGYWFLNPGYTVSSSIRTAEFFRTVLNIRSTWLRTCRQILGTSGHRQAIRQIEHRGKQEAVLTIDATPGAETAPHSLARSVSLALLSEGQRSEAIEFARVAKSLAFSGILFIDGYPVPPRAWKAKADESLSIPLEPVRNPRICQALQSRMTCP